MDSDHRMLSRTYYMLGCSLGIFQVEIMLILCDHTDEEYRLSQLSRDTMHPNVTSPERYYQLKEYCTDGI